MTTLPLSKLHLLSLAVCMILASAAQAAPRVARTGKPGSAATARRVKPGGKGSAARSWARRGNAVRSKAMRGSRSALSQFALHRGKKGTANLPNGRESFNRVTWTKTTKGEAQAVIELVQPTFDDAGNPIDIVHDTINVMVTNEGVFYEGSDGTSKQFGAGASEQFGDNLIQVREGAKGETIVDIAPASTSTQKRAQDQPSFRLVKQGDKIRASKVDVNSAGKLVRTNLKLSAGARQPSKQARGADLGGQKLSGGRAIHNSRFGVRDTNVGFQSNKSGFLAVMKRDSGGAALTIRTDLIAGKPGTPAAMFGGKVTELKPGSVKAFGSWSVEMTPDGLGIAVADKSATVPPFANPDRAVFMKGSDGVFAPSSVRNNQPAFESGN